MRIISTQQRSEAWFQARRGMPTASRFDSILTPKTGKPAAAQDTLINELIAEAIQPPQEGVVRYMSDEMEQGMRLEAEARCCYELEFATEPVLEVGFMIHDYGVFGGSPDALCGETGGVEIKCPQASTHIGYVREGILPWAYRCQVHGYMIVSGRDWWDFFSYARGFKPFYLRVNRDEFTDMLERELYLFVARLNTERAKFGLPKLWSE